ncbi:MULTISPECIES: diacylglycerol kinase family protein [Lactococcus]|uniref:diacylglycerol/lipid kinase family protein n=1 Tax=Lactococcus TaxID=1357 RepID=UPI00071C4457|nr:MULTISPECIES: diacylglycerol kinase family protein [Lactococcus]KAF6609640.1 diacylglycerol kinase family lipid kinase [Lactococcus sp. EKM201L]KAF6613649.1 diacylglycerol kinase family lipid kinase [Lactococcus sp. EKM203L]KAF6640725.1 diacylglycerol kinase family lipid kinase [Lactococcus sp. EKM501L]KAF6645990.1 diacylglycerol kinase family lipid kinase [Lactococcus sp. EKM502L]KAF6651589.1 diacylglycerol kinase family lipid kinase [Lactococcus sp. EKM101L]
MTYYLLANPNSGAGKGARTLETLIPYLEKNNYEYRLFKTKAAGEEGALVRQILDLKNPDDHLVIIGGDGTISLVINELPEEEAFSYIPSGSGNDFARSLKLKLDPIESFEAARRGINHEIFIMNYQSKGLSGYALNNIGIGLDATIVKSANEGKLKQVLNKLKLGSFSYILTALHVLITKKPFPALIEVENQEISLENAFLMTFTKHPYFGGGVKISPEATNENADIHLVEYNKHHLLRTFSLIPSVLCGVHLKHPLFLHRVSSQFSVELAESQPVQIDGEIHELVAADRLSISTERRMIIY